VRKCGEGELTEKRGDGRKLLLQTRDKSVRHCSVSSRRDARE
jgi:hypothetical protein